MLKNILMGLVLIVGGFVMFAATRPDTYHVERSTRIDAPARVVFGQLEDLKAWATWSPWDKRDPQMQKTFEGPATGVGARTAWRGNKQVGTGRMEITEVQPPTLIKVRLTFIEPFAAVANSAFNLAPDGDKAVTVTWSMDGTNNLVGKVFGLFMDMDDSVGGDFAKGLAGLKTIAEEEGKRQSEVAAAAKAQADAAALAKAQAEAAAVQAAADTAAAATKGRRPSKR